MLPASPCRAGLRGEALAGGTGGLQPVSGLQLAGCPARRQPALHLLTRLIKKELKGGEEQGEVCPAPGGRLPRSAEGCTGAAAPRRGHRLRAGARALPLARGPHRAQTVPALWVWLRGTAAEELAGTFPRQCCRGNSWRGSTSEGEVENLAKSLPVRGRAICLGGFPLRSARRDAGVKGLCRKAASCFRYEGRRSFCVPRLKARA